MKYVCSILLGLIALATSQAPGDEDSFCLEISSAPAYAPSVKPLMDSWRYRQLLGQSGVWHTLERDGDLHNWMSTPSEICQESVFVAEPAQLPQNNWLITQYISTAIPTPIKYQTIIYVNITYKFEETCSTGPPNTCYPSFVLKNQITNGVDQTVANDTDSYTVLAQYSPSNDSTNMQFVTVNFMVQNENGFYLALFDNGTNVTVSRVLVYRFKGPSKQVNKTIFDETPAPATGTIMVMGTCIANAGTINGFSPNVTLDSAGIWSNPDMCYCIEGHHSVSIGGAAQCQACEKGTYKAGLGNTACLTCPASSESNQAGAAICGCRTRSYRAMGEGPEVPCTRPPSAPSRTNLVGSTGDTAFISWDPPSILGGRTDLFYNILLDNGTYLVQKNTEPIYATNFTITGLQPLTIYIAFVLSENGVSLYEELALGRGAQISFKTGPGVPLQVVGVSIADELVTWQPLNNSRGQITQYEVRFYVNSASEATGINVPTNSYQPNITADLPSSGQPVLVQVRGYTEAGAGPWSEPVTYANINPRAPTTVSLSATPAPPLPATPIPALSSSSRISSSVTRTTQSTPTAHPPSSGSPLVSILAILGAVVGIIIVLTIAAILVAVIRYPGKVKKFFTRSRCCGKSEEGTDSVGIVRYTDVALDEVQIED